MFYLLLLNLAATWFMCGVIWFVQVAHYPLFAYADQARWSAFHKAHQMRTSIIVVVPMLVEMLTSCALLFTYPGEAALVRVAFVANVLLWVSTALVQVPHHRKLTKDGSQVRVLVAANWVRTALWSLRSGVVLVLVYRVLP